ncbi:hypothetical protein LH464_02725 [Neorhizobium sp. T786]|nr:hypothetical protein [Neorhizobium xiangyangii]MCB5201393.1 hypothetical protein [Neorhizobium xiangyangii]
MATRSAASPGLDPSLVNRPTAEESTVDGPDHRIHYMTTVTMTSNRGIR